MSTPNETPGKNEPTPPIEATKYPDGDPARLMGLGLPSEAGGNPSLSPDEYETLEAGASVGAAPAPAAPSGGHFVPPSVDELAGLFPQLQIVELLGHGGMGAVYKARQTVLDRFVAVKILPPQVSRSPGFAQRFMREARALARLSHPNIVAVHDFGKVNGPHGDLYYIVMEYIDGTNLRQLIRSGAVTPDEALAIVPQVCEALQFAHDEGIVHRDIKPENILIDKKGRVRIADFGLAKLAPSAPGAPGAGEAGHDVHTLTHTGGTMGTPRYMAPEQLDGAHDVDHRADIYSLGVVFYELLTGQIPMGRFDPPSRKVQVDVRLDEVVLRTLEREPSRRYQQAGQIKTDVEQVSRTPGPRPLKPLGQMSLGDAARELFVPEELDKPETSPRARWGRVAAILIGVVGTQILLSGMKLSIVVMMLLVVPLLIMMGVIAIKHHGTRRGRQAKFVIGMLAFMAIGIPLIMFMSNPQPGLNRIYEMTGATPGPDDAKIIQGTFLLIVFGALLSLVGYWLKLRQVKWHQAWNRGSALLMLAAIVVAAYVFAANRNKPVPIVYPFYGDTGFLESSDGPVLSDALAKKLGINARQQKEANRIFQDYYRKFVSLERRHTTHDRGADGKVTITIEPFPDEMHKLMEQLTQELRGIVDSRVAPPLPEKGKVHSNIGLFRTAGEAKVTVTLWVQDNGPTEGKYNFKQEIQWLDGGSHMSANRGDDASAFPEHYRLYWVEQNGPGAKTSEVFATILGETGPDTSGLDQGLVRYRVTGPVDHKLVTWVEYYVKGEKRKLSEFRQTFWRIPRPGEGINELVELRLQDGHKLSPEAKGKLRWDWCGTGGWMPSPFLEMGTVSWSGPEDRRWSLASGEDAILWAMKGGKGNWSSSLHWGSPAAGIMAEAKDADAFLVLKARIEPVTEAERRSGRGGGRLGFEDDAYVPPTPAPAKAHDLAVYHDVHSASVNVVAVTPDGRTIVSCDAVGKIIGLDIAGGTRFQSEDLEASKAPATAWLSSLAISPSGTDLYAGGHWKVLHVAMGKTPTAPRKIVSASEVVHLLASYDGGNKLACLDSHELVFHDLQANTALARVPVRPDKSTGSVRATAASPDGGHIAVCFSDKDVAGAQAHKLTVHDVARQGAITLTWNLPESDDSWYARVVFTDNRTLALCLPRGEIRRWTLDDAGTWKADFDVVSIRPGRYSAMAASRDGKLIYLAQGKRILTLDAKTGQEATHADLQVGPQRGNSVSAEVNSIAATDQPNRVVAALWDGRVAVVSLNPETRP